MKFVAAEHALCESDRDKEPVLCATAERTVLFEIEAGRTSNWLQQVLLVLVRKLGALEQA